MLFFIAVLLCRLVSAALNINAPGNPIVCGKLRIVGRDIANGTLVNVASYKRYLPGYTPCASGKQTLISLTKGGVEIVIAAEQSRAQVTACYKRSVWQRSSDR